MIAALLLHASVAEAAARPRVIEPGSTVRIVEVARKDAYWRFRADLVGKVCLVGEPGLVRHAGRWYAGELSCGEASPYYFYKVEVEVGEFEAPPSIAGGFGPEGLAEGEDDGPLSLGEVVGTASPEGGVAGGVLGGLPPVAPAPVDAEWPVGARGRIRAVSTADATFDHKPSVKGMTCTVTGDPLLPSGDGWFSGALRCDGTGDWFFFQVALDHLPDAATTGAAPSGSARKADGRLTGAPVAPGRLVRIVDVAAADLHHRDRAALIGKQCSVVEASLQPTGEGWYAGRLFCGADNERQFFQVAVAPN